ncbi:RICIN domain-containing protein [Streptomyces sp. NPDC054887]
MIPKLGRVTLVLLMASAAAIDPLVASAAPVGYYVDCNASSDGDGSHSAPWNKLSSVNARTFTPGDMILLKRGTTCTGQQLSPKGSGSAGQPIKIDAYGEGARPVLAGDGKVTDVVLLSNQQHWEIRNLDISNTGATEATRRGVYITRTDAGTGNHYVLENLRIHDINGNKTKKDDDASAGIFFEVLGHTTKTRFDDVQVLNNSITTVDRYGIHLWTRWMTRPALANPNCGTTCGTWNPQTRVVVRGNTVSDIGGDAIALHHTDGALAEHNRVDGFRIREPKHCAAGLWGWNTQDALFQFNEVSGGRSTCDGQGFDLDEANIRTTYQYNYSHDNEGGFLLLCNGRGSVTDRSTVRYNISQNDQGQLFDFVCDKGSNAAIYNNTFYLNKKVEVVYNGNQSTAANAAFWNNIFHVATPEASYHNATSLLFDSNVFHGHHPAGEPADKNKITSDPRLTAPGTGSSLTAVDGYKLQSGSPVIGTGRVALTANARDYFGSEVQTGCRPDRGAHQLSQACVPQQTGPITEGMYQLVAGTKALDVPDWSTTPGTKLVVYDQNNGANQKWQVQRNTDDTFTLMSVSSGLCADVLGNSTSAGAEIGQWTCSGGNNQRWTVAPNGSGYTFTSLRSGMLLTAPALTNLTVLRQEPSSASGTQVWGLRATS